MRTSITKIMDYINRERTSAADIARGYENAYETLLEAAFNASSPQSLIEVVDVLERHAMDDETKPYMVCWGERECYQRTRRLLERMSE